MTREPWGTPVGGRGRLLSRLLRLPGRGGEEGRDEEALSAATPASFPSNKLAPRLAAPTLAACRFWVCSRRASSWSRVAGLASVGAPVVLDKRTYM